MKKAIIYLVVFLALEVTLGLAASLLTSPEAASALGTDLFAKADPLAVNLTVTALIAVSLLAVFLPAKWCPVSRDYIRSRPWGTLFWTILLGLGVIIPLTWLEEFLPEAWTVNLLKEEMAEMLHSTAGYFVVAMLMPLAEEVVFRGAIIRALSATTRSAWVPIVVSALFFAGAHMNPAQMPHAFLAGLILGWLFVRTGSIIPGFLVHWINNSASYALAALYPHISVDDPLSAYFGGSESAVIRAVISSLLIAIPSFYQVHLLTRKR